LEEGKNENLHQQIQRKETCLLKRKEEEELSLEIWMAKSKMQPVGTTTLTFDALKIKGRRRMKEEELGENNEEKRRKKKVWRRRGRNGLHAKLTCSILFYFSIFPPLIHTPIQTNIYMTTHSSPN